jgi:solute carrier family 25 thiamine pyrophosphate transporter 19
VVKIRQQLQVHHWREAGTISGPTYHGIISSIRTIARAEGVAALWKGNVSAELLYVAYGASQFYVYNSIQDILGRSTYLPHTSHAFISGACAGAMATTVTYPLDCLRTRFAAQGRDRVYQSLSQAVGLIYKTEGTGGLFRGLSTALIQIVPNLAIFFGTYEPLRVLYRDITPSSFSDWGSPIAGGAAGVIAKTAVFPLDLLRKRLQVQGVTRTMYIHRNIPIYSSAWTALHIIVRHEGVRGLFKGLTVSLVKAAPNSAITMFMYEHVMLFLSSRSS